MREILTDKNFLLTKFIFILKLFSVLALLLFFLPLFILPFFNHASADDYYYGDQFYKLGFWGYQKYIYNNWSGRFSATFISAFFLRGKYLYDHYYLHTLLFLALNFLTSFLLIRVAGRRFLNRNISFSTVLFISAVFNALIIVCMPGVSAFLFWFSSSIIYFTGLVFVQLEILLCLLLYNASGAFTKMVYFILIPLIVFVVNGFSEVFVVMQFSILLLLFATGFFKKTGLIFFSVFLFAFIASALLSFAAPGNQVRAEIIPLSDVRSAIGAFVFALIKTTWTIFKNPLAWLFLAMCVMCGYYNQSELSKIFSNRKHYYISIVLCLLLIFPVISLAEVVIGLKGKIVPDRFINIVCWFMLLLLCLLSFLLGTLLKFKSLFFILNKLQLQIIFYTVLFVCLCSNEYISTAYKSILSAPVYNTIINNRESIFKDAAGKNVVPVVMSYDLAFKKYMNEYRPKSSGTYYGWVKQKPELIFNDNGDSDDQSIMILKNFYHVDSVIIKK